MAAWIRRNTCSESVPLSACPERGTSTTSSMIVDTLIRYVRQATPEAPDRQGIQKYIVDTWKFDKGDGRTRRMAFHSQSRPPKRHARMPRYIVAFGAHRPLSSPWACSFPRSFDLPKKTTGSMRVKPYSLLLCLLLTPFISHAESKTVYGLNEHVALPDFDLEL